MTTINLRKFYPFYTHDEYIEVSDEVAVAMADADRLESNYRHRRKIYYHRAQYSLDCSDGIENSALFFALAPDEIYEHKWTIEQIYAALDALPKKQRRRVYDYYICGVRQVEIARREGVSVSNVSASIRRGMENMAILLKNL